MNIGTTIFNNLKQKYKKPDEKFRICFCPYKLEMFDCMETVWEEAFADTEETVTTIVPLPYFEKKNTIPYKINHEFTNYYKKNFPCRLNEKWDCIVIHNTYDAYNNLTQLMISCPELKQFCKYLVYIPYFVPYSHPLAETHIDTMGNRFVDLIIVDSEETRNDYISVLSKRYPNFTEEKIVAWGSPKYDFVNKKQFIPAEWQGKVADRKVILYQTSLIPLYQNPEKKIEQIERTIKMYADKENVSLIYRPHPLYEIVLQKFPQLLKRYEAVKMELLSSKKDIFDGTGDWQSAFDLSDEMISDPSSLVPLYKATNKPLHIVQ